MLSPNIQNPHPGQLSVLSNYVPRIPPLYPWILADELISDGAAAFADNLVNQPCYYVMNWKWLPRYEFSNLLYPVCQSSADKLVVPNAGYMKWESMNVWIEVNF